MGNSVGFEDGLCVGSLLGFADGADVDRCGGRTATISSSYMMHGGGGHSRMGSFSVSGSFKRYVINGSYSKLLLQRQ